MAKSSQIQEAGTTVKTAVSTDEFATKIFTKSGYPKTIKENIKLVLNFVINFLC